MTRTKIEWVKNPDGSQGYTKNAIKGKCKMGCKDLDGEVYCFAIKLYDRFKWNPEVRFVPEILDEIDKLKNPSTIFLCSTHELFGYWIPDEWILAILNKIRENPQHTFIILTKNSVRASLWNFPDNVWLGTTIDGTQNTEYLLKHLKRSNAKIKFISFEPLLNEVNPDLEYIDWIIVGARTQPYKPPKKKWVERLMTLARQYDIPIFLKNNLRWYKKIQNFPNGSEL